MADRKAAHGTGADAPGPRFHPQQPGLRKPEPRPGRRERWGFGVGKRAAPEPSQSPRGCCALNRAGFAGGSNS